MVPCPTRREPTVTEALKDIAFPSIHLVCEYNMAEGRGSLPIYPQTLLVGIKAAAKLMEILSKVYNVRLTIDKSQKVFFEVLPGDLQEVYTI